MVEKHAGERRAEAHEDEGRDAHARDVDPHLAGAVGIVADRAHPRAESVAVEQQGREHDERQRPEDLHRKAVDLAREQRARRRILQFEQRDRFALRDDHDEAAQHVVHAERRDQRRQARGHNEGADAGAERHAGRERRDDAEERAQARVHDEREDPGRESHRGRERKIDLADRDDEHQRHDEAERDRQGDENRIVDRPMQEHRRAGGHEDRDHHDEHGEACRAPRDCGRRSA